MLTIRKITKLQWHEIVVPDQCGTETCAQPEKKHPTANMTAKRLHGGVVNDPNRLFERANKIEPDPSFAEMFRVLYDFSIAYDRWKTD